MTRRPRMRLGEGITGAAADERAPVMLPAQAHLDPRFKSFPNLPEDEYESILAVPILAREKLEGALNVRTRRAARVHASRDRPAARDRGPGRAVDPARAALRRTRSGASTSSRRWRGSPRRSPSRSTSRSRSRRSCRRRWTRSTRRARRSCSRTGTSPGRRAAPARYAVRLPLRWSGRQIGELVCDRDTPFTDDDRQLLARSRTTPRSRSSTDAR